MDFWLFEKKTTAAQAVSQPAEPAQAKPPYLTQTVVFGHGDSTVCFVDESRGIRKMLVNARGGICSFPGIREESFWVKKVSSKVLLPQIRYRTSFEKRENQWIVFWTIQPDGDYWRDESGFGGENEEEVVLYTYVNENGNFTGPFRIYEVGEKCYALDRFVCAHERDYADALEALQAGTLRDGVDVLFPRLYGMELYAGYKRVWERYTLCHRTMAEEYWAHPVLSRHLREATEVLLESDATIMQIVGYPGNKIVHSCMTLFYAVTREKLFQEALDRFFDGQEDSFTRERLSG